MQITIRPLRTTDTPAASGLVQAVFDGFEAPDYTPQGVAVFHRLTTSEAMAERLGCGAMQAWGAYREERLVGVLATRDTTHISLLFVDPPCHRQGIARTLFTHLCAHIRTISSARRITVNSSPYAVEAYCRMGFVPTDSERTTDGIRFTAMEFRL